MFYLFVLSEQKSKDSVGIFLEFGVALFLSFLLFIPSLVKRYNGHYPLQSCFWKTCLPIDVPMIMDTKLDEKNYNPTISRLL